jgi:hypothetical protein
MVGFFSRSLIGFGLVAALALALPVKPAYAVGEAGEASTTEAAEAPAKVAAHRAAVAENKRYFVEFRGRSAATYGHLYILFGELNARGEVIKSKIAGLYPAGDRQDCDNCSLANWTIGHLIFVPSGTTATDGDLEEKYVTARYRVMLDKAQYDKLTDYVANFQANPPLWNALFKNCVSFGRDVADLLGLKVPQIMWVTPWLEPEQFVTQLRELNGTHEEQAPLKDASNGTGMPETRAVAHRAPAKKRVAAAKRVTAEIKATNAASTEK